MMMPCLLAAASLSIQPALSIETAEIYRELGTVRDKITTEEEAELDWLKCAVRNRYPLSDDMASRLHALQQPTLKLILQASEMPPPDFELQWDLGWDLLLPHLSDVWHGGRTISMHLSDRIQTGDAHRIREAMRATRTMSEHTRADPCLISMMVALSIQKNADEQILSCLESGAITPEIARILLPAIDQPRDNFGLVESIERERQFTSEWLVTKLKLDEADDAGAITPEAIDLLQNMLSVSAGPTPEPTEAWTNGALKQELRQLDAHYETLVEIAADQDWKRAGRRAESLEMRADLDSDLGLAKTFAPDIAAIIKNRNEYEDERRELAKRLRALSEGKQIQTNAAWLWIRAGERAAGSDAIWIDVPDERESIDSLLTQSQQQREAGYPPPWEDYLEAPIPWWLPDQDALLHGLLVRAGREVAKGASSGTAADLDLVLRIIGALSDHPTIASGILAANAAERCAAVLRDALRTGVLNAEERSMLLQRVRTINPRDPAGLNLAVSATRSRMKLFLFNPFTLPESDTALLNAIAWQRGVASTDEWKLEYVVPGGNPQGFEVMFLDGELLEGWYGLGQRQDKSVPLDSLGGIDLDDARKRMQNALDSMRSLLK
ncbi:MAG: hypothetical protein MK100_00185 [Phycisphaerales bacterium]|nr:hypothetical protein [Phycisphaerales bacterium]